MKIWIFTFLLLVSTPLKTFANDNACGKEYRAIVEEVMAQSTNGGCIPTPMSAENEKELTEMMDYFGSGIPLFEPLFPDSEEIQFTALDFTPYVCTPVDGQNLEGHNIIFLLPYLLELSNEAMQTLEMEEENLCVTFMWTQPDIQVPSSSSYEWIDFPMNKLSKWFEGPEESTYLVTMNKKLAAKMRTAIAFLLYEKEIGWW